MNPEIVTGGIISPPDYRDYIASASILPVTSVQLPPTLNTQLGSVLMQGKIPACVSHSISLVLSLWWFRKTGVWVDFSPRFLDILSDEVDIPFDGGRRPRTVLKVALNQGCCTTKTLPNDVTLSIEQYRDVNAITSEAYQEALQYKIPGFINVQLDFQSMRTAMYLYGAVSTLFSVGEQMYKPSWLPKDVDPLRTPNPVTSGHQMTGKGWSSPTLNLLRNSWSESWGNKGETEYNPTDWAPYIYESWTPAEIPSNIIDFMKALPSPKDFHYQWNTDLKRGDFNDDVKFAQIVLMILQILKPIDPADLGYFGPKTCAAVMAYQQLKGIHPVAPNNIGPKTRQALNLQFKL